MIEERFQIRKKSNYLFMVILALMLALAACGPDEEGSKGNNGNNNEEVDGNQENKGNNDPDEVAEFPTDPVTIRVAQAWGEDIFESRFKSMEDKYPYLTIEHVPFNGSREALEELFAHDVEFDIIVASDIALMEEYDVIYPLDDMVEKYGYDLDELHPALLNYIRSSSSGDELVGFPDGTSYQALFYNKEVFDKFGEPYPDPDVPMTWEETFDLAAKMTETRDGVDYLGLTFNPQSTTRVAPLKQLGLNMTDPETGEVLLTEEQGFHRYLSLMEDFLNIPGMPPEALQSYVFGYKQAAMTIAYNVYLSQDWGDKEFKKDMDIAPLPVWDDLPDTGPELGTWPLIISKYSENKDAAFQVLVEYVSKDNQLEIARNMGGGPVLVDEEVREQFGALIPGYEGKNMAAFFKHNPVEMDVRSQWDKYVNIHDEGGALDKLVEGIDINTILREISEDAEAKIQDEKANR